MKKEVEIIKESEEVITFLNDDQLHTVFAISVLVLMCFLFLRFRKALLKENGVHSFIKEEVKTVHKRVDNLHDKIDIITREQSEMKREIGFISGRLKSD